LHVIGAMPQPITSLCCASMDLALIIASVLHRSTNPPLASDPTAHLALGRWGEDEASRHLKRLGWKILRRNFRAPGGGEVDLVCRDHETLVFAEVKTRRSEELGRPIDAVDQKKQRLIRRGAMHWLRLLEMPDLTFRFDVIEVLATDPVEIRVVESAFTLPDPLRY
ncbi:MAG: YraN family protein, partial [Chthoniobacterales bacterium]